MSKELAMYKKTIILFLVIFLNGCVTKTPYQSIAYSGGYSNTIIDENIFKVSFKGNGFTSKERVEDFTLLRSAEITLQYGFKYFIIINSDSYSTLTAYQNNIYSKPSSTNMIKCFKRKPKFNTIIYNANFIKKSIKEKYNIK
jgi:hypothetical protein